MAGTDVYSVGVGEVAEAYGVTVPTVRSWSDAGKLVSFRTPGGQRRFRLADNPELANLLTPSVPGVGSPSDTGDSLSRPDVT